MAGKNKSTVPVFKIEKPERVTTALARVTIPRTQPEKLGAVLSDLLGQVAKAGHKVKVVKGSLTCY